MIQCIMYGEMVGDTMHDAGVKMVGNTVHDVDGQKQLQHLFLNCSVAYSFDFIFPPFRLAPLNPDLSCFHQRKSPLLGLFSA